MLKQIVFLALMACALAAQEPQVKVNYLNVCAPTATERGAIEAALALIPAKPVFSNEFEVARGRSTVDGLAMNWVRIRREFASGKLLNVQYSFSNEAQGLGETIVFRVRDPQRDGPLQVQIFTASRALTPQSVYAESPRVERIRVERFGASSAVLARCEGDQSAFAPLFASYGTVLRSYRAALRVATTVPAEWRKLR